LQPTSNCKQEIAAAKIGKKNANGNEVLLQGYKWTHLWAYNRTTSLSIMALNRANESLCLGQYNYAALGRTLQLFESHASWATLLRDLNH
jgi:hypothetical protein